MRHQWVQGESSRKFIILATGALITMTGGLVAPVLPQVINDLNFDRALATHLVSVHALTLALFSPLLGLVADWVSPKRVLIPSLVLYGIFGTMGAFLSNFWLLLTSRALLGATAGGIAAGSLGLLGKLYDQDTRAQILAYATAVLTVTGIIFPLLGGGVGSINWRYAFIIYAVAFPLAMMSQSAFPDVQSSSNHENVGLSTTLRKLLSSAAAIERLLLVTLTAAIMYSVVIYAPLYLEETLGLGTVENGVLLAIRALGAALISVFASKKIVKQLSINGTIAIGFGLMGLSLFSIPFLQQFLFLLTSALVFGIGFGLALPNLYSSLSNLAPKSLRSSILAIAIGTSFLGQFISPLLFSPILAAGGLTGVFNTSAVLALLGGFFLALRERSPLGN